MMTVCCAAIFTPRGIKELRPSADWDWVWDWVWVTLGSRQGHPSVTKGSPKRRIAEAPLFATEVKKWGGGRRNRVIARDRRPTIFVRPFWEVTAIPPHLAGTSIARSCCRVAARPPASQGRNQDTK